MKQLNYLKWGSPMAAVMNSSGLSGTALKKVLVVDDESIIRLSLKKFLEDEGFYTLTASTGIDALKK